MPNCGEQHPVQTTFSDPPSAAQALRDFTLAAAFALLSYRAAASTFDTYLFPELQVKSTLSVVPSAVVNKKQDARRPASSTLHSRWHKMVDSILQQVKMLLGVQFTSAPRSSQAILFGTTFALSWLPLALLVCEMLGLLAPWSRERLWQISLHGLVFCLLLVVPWVAAAAVFRDWWPPPAMNPPVAPNSSAAATAAAGQGGSLGGRKARESSSDFHGYLAGYDHDSGGRSISSSNSFDSTSRPSTPRSVYYNKGRTGRVKVHKPLHFFEPFGVFTDMYRFIVDVPLYRRPEVQALALLVPYWLLLLRLSKQLPLDAAATTDGVPTLALNASLGASSRADSNSASRGDPALIWVAKAALKASLWPLRALWSTAAMRHAVQRLAVVGSALAAVLSGIGAVGLPCDYLLGRAALLAPLRSRAKVSASCVASSSGATDGVAARKSGIGSSSSSDSGDLGSAANLLAERTTTELQALNLRLASKTRALLLERRRLARSRPWAHEHSEEVANSSSSNRSYSDTARPPPFPEETQWWSWLGGGDGDSYDLSRSNRGSLSSGAVDALREEVDTLRIMSQDLFLELVELHAAATEAREDAARAPWLQRSRRLLGWLLALSGSWRVAMAVVHVAGSSTNQRAAFASRAEGADAATTVWLLLHRMGLGSSALGQFIGRQGLPFWSQGLGLVLVASLGLASASGFLSAVQRARRASLTSNQPSSPAPSPLLSSSSSSSSGSWALSAESIAPLTTLSLGAYLLGSLLLLRVQVPCRFRHGALALVLGDVEFGFYHQWFDTVFAVAALAAAATRMAAFRGAREAVLGLDVTGSKDALS